MKRVGLVLGGGGARGLCFIEFCRVLDELGVKPVMISGTSIGAIIGAFYAAGISADQMEKELESITLLKIPKLVDPHLVIKTALFKGHRLEAYFRATLGCDQFEQLPIPLRVNAADYWSREEIVFDHGPLIPAIRASMSLPVIFEPVIYQNRVLIDGGAVNPLPVDLIRAHCDYLIAIDVSGSITPSKHRNFPRLFDSIMGTFQTMQCSIIGERLKHTHVECYVRPQLVNFGILDFFQERDIRASVAADVEWFRETLIKDLLV